MIFIKCFTVGEHIMTTKIAIIGIDGSGKTTLINKLEKRLILNGYAVKKCSYKQHNYTILEEYSSKFFITQEMRMYASFFVFYLLLAKRRMWILFSGIALFFVY